MTDSLDGGDFVDDLLPPHDGSSAQDDFNTPSWAYWIRHQEQLSEFIADESPRGAAVLCRGYLEAALEELLLLHALNELSARKKIGQALNAGLEAKISVCGALGLIDNKTREEADRIRKVGDRFAHWPEVTGTQDDVVRKLLADMSGTVFFKLIIEHPSNGRRRVVDILRMTLTNVLAHVADRVVPERERWITRSGERSS